jgi:hypothetical protein
MFIHLALLSSVLVPAAAKTQQHVSFDAASASSTYSAGNLAGSPAFAAQQSLSGGSGYWSYIVFPFIHSMPPICCWQWGSEVLQRQPHCRIEFGTQLRNGFNM